MTTLSRSSRFSAKARLLSLFVATSLLGLTACQPAHHQAPDEAQDKAEKPPVEQVAEFWPQVESELKQNDQVEEKVEALLATLSIEQKVAQTIQPEIRDISVEDMRKYGFGSYLNGGGAYPNDNKQATLDDWVDLAEAMYQASVDDSLDGTNIPTMWGTDAVHGHNNVIGATLFPHNIGLGAMHNPALIEKIARATALEVLATGIDWIFAPTVATVRDDRWGRTYEGYSEDPQLVSDYAYAMVKGMQGAGDTGYLAKDGVISTVKHFIGDGGTDGGDDQGDNMSTEAQLFNIHGQGYVSGIRAGAQTVMASFNSWQGEKVHGNRYLLTDVLKTRMGFDGLVVGDWNGHGQIPGCSNENCAQAMNAGLDIFMVPTQAWKPLYENTIAQVKDGTIAQSRLDDAVRRILRVKVRAGLFDSPSPKQRQFAGQQAIVGSAEHRSIARQAVRESLVLLKNNDQLLPLSPKQHILIAGDGANNIAKQSGGWSITWQGTNNLNSDFIGATSILDGLQTQIAAAGGQVSFSKTGDYAASSKPDVAIVVFGEDPYAEGHGDRQDLAYHRVNPEDLALLRRLQAEGIPVVSVFISGRPMWVNPELNASDAFLAAWLPGSEGAGVADVLLRDGKGNVQHGFVGKLSFSWPDSPVQQANLGDENYAPLLAYNFGLRYGEASTLANDLNEKFDWAEQAETEKTIYAGKVFSPWKMWLFNAQEQVSISANRQQLAGLTYRTTDRLVQEDSFSLVLDGNQQAQASGLRITSKGYFREDLQSQLLAQSSLNIAYKLNAEPSDKVLLGMHCESTGDAEGSCRASQDITALLNGKGIGEWQQISVDLACYAQAGIKFAGLVAPFELSSQGKLDIQISNISMLANNAAQADIQCH